jgi:hypothetical protein
VLIVTHHRDRRWLLRISDNKPISFTDLIAWLSGIAASMTENVVGQIVVKCVGINAWKDASYPASPKAKKKPRPPAKRPTTLKKERKPPPKKKSAS